MVDPVPTRKADLRRRMLLGRDLIEDRTMRSVSIWAQVAELDEYRRASTVMAFSGMRGEPDTDPLVARLARDGKALVLPSMEDDRIVPRSTDGEDVDLDRLDLVIVPGLAFTDRGHRLGRGKGHYDRFLATLPPGVPTVGVCFAEQLLDDLPVEEHDVVLRRVVVDDVPPELPDELPDDLRP